MIKKILLLILLISLVGCSKNVVDTSEEIVCSAPYMRHADDCCLDQNVNSICDSDETPVDTIPKVEDIPLAPENTQPVQVTEKCELPSDLKCVSYSYFDNSLQLIIENTADFDMNSMDIILESEDCSSKGTLGKPLMAGDQATIKLVCPAPEEGFVGKLRFIYRNADTQEYQNKKGLVVLNI